MNREELLQIAKPILFNTDMVRAILDGRKTVTRRLCKIPGADYIEIDTDGNVIGIYNQYEGKVLDTMAYAPYQIGDFLYVRETWHKYKKRVGKGEGCHIAEIYEYKASIANSEDANEPWHPSIHMPKEAARIFLKVTDVHVERLQDITNVDAIYEGALKCDKCETKEYKKAVMTAKERGEEPPLGYTPIERFAALWDSTCKKSIQVHGWEANPWVWVIEFARLDV